jgi:non-homologous end joining protein Ku
MDALKKSLEARKPPQKAKSAAGTASEQEAEHAVAEHAKRKRAPRKARTA